MIGSRRMRWVGPVSHIGDERNACKVLVRMPEVKRLLGRPRHRWEGNIKMDCKDVG
jgi:hypothetical protein